MTRIRYEKLSDGNHVSKQIIAIGNMPVLVLINGSSLVYNLINNDTKQIVFEGKGKTLHEVKKNVKKQLSAMGVVFSPEIRVKKQVHEPKSIPPVDHL